MGEPLQKKTGAALRNSSRNTILKTLFKKQLLEANTWLLQDKKTGKRLPPVKMAGMLLLYVVLFGILGAMFYGVANSLCAALLFMGMGWLYFAMMGLLSIMLGVFGSVFNTYAMLFLAKDNEMLLSLPVPPRSILLVRLFSVWFWGIIYEALVFVPTLIVYWISLATDAPTAFAAALAEAGVAGAAETELILEAESALGAAGLGTAGGLSVWCVVSGLLLLVVISVFVLTLTCVLGWVVAQISVHVKKKAFVTVAASLAFIVLYYWVYFKAYSFLQSFLTNAALIGQRIKGIALPLYWLGRGGEGDVLSLVLVAALNAALLVAVFVVLSRSFLKLATTSRGTARREYKEKASKVRSVPAAMFFKELGRFTSSATYMLNCALGTLMLPIMGIVLIVAGGKMLSTFQEIASAEMIELAVLAGICTMACMNDISAPSVSLEGKNLWVSQSLPIPAWTALKAKLALHLALTSAPLLFSSVCAIIALRPPVLGAVFLLVLPQLFVLVLSALGLVVNLNMPNLTWTNETAPVKQSMSVTLCLFGGWILVAALAGLWFVTRTVLPTYAFMLVCAVLLGGAAAGLVQWLRTRGAQVFAKL